MTRETKAGLLMIVMLAGVFGFMVYKRLPPRSAALAQQDMPSTEELAATEREVASKDPFLTDDPKQKLPTESNVIPAVATIPAQIPDAKGDESNSARPIGNHDRRPVRDPFEIELTRPVPKHVPTPTAVDAFPDEKRPSKKMHGGLTVVAAESSAASQAPTASESADDEFNPFESAEAEPTAERNSIPATASNDTASNAISNAASNEESSEPDFGPPARMTNAQKLPTEEIAVSENDPFEADSKPAAVTFEPPVANRPRDIESETLLQDARESDPFADNNLEVQKPTVKPVASPTVEAPVLSFENQPETGPANEPASIDDAFDQSPKPSQVPTLKIPSAPARPSANDERFGGFRPAAPSTAPGNTAPEARPSIPVSTAEPERRTSRPAPATQIDEDFGARPSARPLIAGDTYQVEPNDNYWSISRKKYGTGRYFMALAQHNSQVITDPRRMRPGVTISTPSAEEMDKAYSQLIPKPAPTNPVQTASASTSGFGTTTDVGASTEPGESQEGFFISTDGMPMYCIGQEDTLSGVAQRHLGRSSRWVQIYELNRDVLKDGNTLKIGTVLRLPADASQVDVVGTARTFR